MDANGLVARCDRHDVDSLQCSAKIALRFEGNLCRRSIHGLTHKGASAFIEIGIMAVINTVATCIHKQQPASRNPRRSRLLRVARDLPEDPPYLVGGLARRGAG